LFLSFPFAFLFCKTLSPLCCASVFRHCAAPPAFLSHISVAEHERTPIDFFLCFHLFFLAPVGFPFPPPLKRPFSNGDARFSFFALPFPPLVSLS
jgi:hypothetical protein